MPSADPDGQLSFEEDRSERPDPVSGQVGPELGGPLSSNQHPPRRVLHIDHDGGKTIVEDMAHIKFTKILCIRRE
ncbi:hypothetical protein BHE74_00056737 [Ensete ventricosum]|nr:hypothetical protein BHE74_00056737 [Ensete ventricosum]